MKILENRSIFAFAARFYSCRVCFFKLPGLLLTAGGVEQKLCTDPMIGQFRPLFQRLDGNFPILKPLLGVSIKSV
jgi:hypothetical protein